MFFPLFGRFGAPGRHFRQSDGRRQFFPDVATEEMAARDLRRAHLLVHWRQVHVLDHGIMPRASGCEPFLHLLQRFQLGTDDIRIITVHGG